MESKYKPVAQSVPAFCSGANVSVALFYRERARWVAEGKPDPLDHIGKKAIVFPDKGEAFVRALAEETKAARELAMETA